MDESKVTVELTIQELKEADVALSKYLLRYFYDDEYDKFVATMSAWSKIREALDEHYVRLYEKDKVQAAEESGEDED